ncbi:hypothetical protein [Neptunicella sp.]|uniref:hypothetical protein n=1 Tax=Neptunicella sp. TaxID=2125986 RepID=UPI003F68C1D6
MLLRFIIIFLLLRNIGICQANNILLDGIKVADLTNAMQKANNGSVILLSAGRFEQAGVLSANNVTIRGVYGKTILHGKTIWGKGALVIRGKHTLIENIECFDIQVKNQNGACIRLDGSDLEINNVYFHDAEQGILTGPNPGHVVINNSRFERLGKAGQAHGIYIGGGSLLINKSRFLSSKDEGHEIKSRARETVIMNSVIASMDGHDSRLIDIPNGGSLKIVDSVLQQGQFTSNWNLIGYGLEGIKHQTNSITIQGNIFILDRPGGSQIMHVQGKPAPYLFSQNTIIGSFRDPIFDNSNLFYSSRQQAGLGDFPQLQKD